MVIMKDQFKIAELTEFVKFCASTIGNDKFVDDIKSYVSCVRNLNGVESKMHECPKVTDVDSEIKPLQDAINEYHEKMMERAQKRFDIAPSLMDKIIEIYQMNADFRDDFYDFGNRTIIADKDLTPEEKAWYEKRVNTDITIGKKVCDILFDTLLYRANYTASEMIKQGVTRIRTCVLSDLSISIRILKEYEGGNNPNGKKE